MVKSIHLSTFLPLKTHSSIILAWRPQRDGHKYHSRELQVDSLGISFFTIPAFIKGYFNLIRYSLLQDRDEAVFHAKLTGNTLKRLTGIVEELAYRIHRHSRYTVSSATIARYRSVASPF
jgi:hypothetical protein